MTEIARMASQKVYCRICASVIYTHFTSYNWEDEVCSKKCLDELTWRKQLASEKKAYYPRRFSRELRIAELSKAKELDSLIKDLEEIPDLNVIRYQIPDEFYEMFASRPSPIGFDFPVATYDNEGQTTRVFGLEEVKKILRNLHDKSFAVTRRSFTRRKQKQPTSERKKPVEEKGLKKGKAKKSVKVKSG